MMGIYPMGFAVVVHDGRAVTRHVLGLSGGRLMLRDRIDGFVTSVDPWATDVWVYETEAEADARVRILNIRSGAGRNESEGAE